MQIERIKRVVHIYMVTMSNLKFWDIYTFYNISLQVNVCKKRPFYSVSPYSIGVTAWIHENIQYGKLLENSRTMIP